MIDYSTPLDFDIRSAYNKADKIYQHLTDTGQDEDIEIVEQNLIAIDNDFMHFVWLIIECKLEKKNGRKYGRGN